MRLNRLAIAVLLCLGMGIVLDSIPCRAQEPYGIEPAACKASAYLPQSVVDALNPDGVRLFTYTNGQKSPILEVFWSRTVKAQSSPATGTLLYGNLTPGTLVGVVHFLAEANEDYREDFHDQKLKPGYYTMRYGVQPEDPEQKQSAARDFLLLSPVGVDRDPAKTPNTDDLTHSSRMASHAKYPAVLSLVPITQGQKEPGVRTDDTGTCVLQFRVKINAGKDQSASEQAMALIVVTPIKDNSGS